MNTSEINGFQIARFNQFDLPVGKKESTCPKCSDTRSPKNQKTKCASLDWNRGIGTCHHCSNVFQLHTFKKGDKEYSKPKENDSSDIEGRVLEYFDGRGISPATLETAKVTASPGWIEFNFYKYGELVNRKSRNGKKEFRLESNCELVWYNHDALFHHKDIIIVEGEVDALSYIEAGHHNVVSVPNGATNFGFLDTSIDLFEEVEKIYLSIDQDEAGEKLKNELIRRLGAEKCFIVSLPGAKDANEFLVGSGAEALSACLFSSTQVPLEHVNTLNDISKELKEFFFEGAKPGYQIGLPEFDSVFSTYTSQFIVVTGIPGHGKSDWIDMMTMGYQKKYGWKTAYASPENKPDHIHASKIFRKYWDGTPTEVEVENEKWNEIHEVINDHFYFIDKDHFTLEEILKKGSELVKRKGIRCLVIDPYNKVRLKNGSGLSIPDYTMEYLQKVDTWSKQHDCLVILAAHPIKMKTLDNGQVAEPTFYDVKGGGEFYDMSYHGLCVYRNKEEGFTKIKVLKCKFQNLGQNGAEVLFTWNEDSSRFHEQKGLSTKMPWESVEEATGVPF